MSKRFAVLLAVMALAGCKTGPQEPDVIVAGVTLPAMSDADLSCPVEPPVPVPAYGEARIRESQLKKYILDLRAAGQACRERLQVVSQVWRATEVKQREVSRAIRPVN